MAGRPASQMDYDGVCGLSYVLSCVAVGWGEKEHLGTATQAGALLDVVSNRAVILQQVTVTFRFSNSHASINIFVKLIGLTDSHFDPKVHIHFLG